MVSFWERESLLRYDVIIIGAGITGLSTAASLKENKPALNVAVLERGTLPTGASTKNAGFACFGSISELAQDRKALGDEGMVNLVSKRWQGLQKTIARLGEQPIGYENKGGYELLGLSGLHSIDTIEEVNFLLRDLFDAPVFTVANKKISHFGFGKTAQLILNPYEGQLHTGKLISNLWQYCSQLGVKIITGTEVTGLQPDNPCQVQTATFTFEACAVAVCTNAFTPSLIKQKLDIRPGRGMVMLIRPEKPLSFEGTFHYEEGYYYFRDFQGKIIFGGGRNIDFETEQTDKFGLNERIERKLLEDLRDIILPGQPFSVEMKWSGIMAFGEHKQPIVEESEAGIFLGARLGGMGVAIGSLVGEELAQMILRSQVLNQ